MPFSWKRLDSNVFGTSKVCNPNQNPERQFASQSKVLKAYSLTFWSFAGAAAKSNLLSLFFFFFFEISSRNAVSITNLAKQQNSQNMHENAPVKCAATSSELGLQNRVT